MATTLLAFAMLTRATVASVEVVSLLVVEQGLRKLI
jgi:hypothetical protein